MGRTMPLECEHGTVIDCGDFGPEDGTQPRCSQCDEQRDERRRAEAQAAMDARVEDVARALHWAQSLKPDRYFDDDYEFGWEDENWGAVKATRLHARELIEKFDARVLYQNTGDKQ